MLLNVAHLHRFDLAVGTSRENIDLDMDSLDLQAWRRAIGLTPGTMNLNLDIGTVTTPGLSP